MKKEYITPMTEQFQVATTAILAGSDPQFTADGQGGTMSLNNEDAEDDAWSKGTNIWDAWD